MPHRIASRASRRSVGNAHPAGWHLAANASPEGRSLAAGVRHPGQNVRPARAPAADAKTVQWPRAVNVHPAGRHLTSVNPAGAPLVQGRVVPIPIPIPIPELKRPVEKVLKPYRGVLRRVGWIR